MSSDAAPFRCPACRARFDLGRVQPGARVRCPKCGATFTREAPGTAAAAAPTAATDPTTAPAGPPPGEAVTERDLDRTGFDFLRELPKVNVATDGEFDLGHTIPFRLNAVTVGERMELLGGVYNWQIYVRDEAVVVAERK